MSDKPTGVFVRLPLSETDARKIRSAIDTPSYEPESLSAELLAIGTPVPGGDLEVVAYDNIASGHLSRVRPCGPNINLVRQPDAQAKIMVLEAEVVRLREENERLHRIAHSGKGSVTQVIHSPTRFMKPDLKGGAA